MSKEEVSKNSNQMLLWQHCQLPHILLLILLLFVGWFLFFSLEPLQSNGMAEE